MSETSTIEFYRAYVQNVRDLKIAEGEVRRTINKALKSGKKTRTVEVHTKLYALTYSTFSESRFMKMLFTPYGFSRDEAYDILSKKSIYEKWERCLTVAFHKYSQHSKGSEIPNKKQTLLRIIQKFIVAPSIIRNKIAHGQLTVALNRENTDLNAAITQQIEDLNVVTIQRWFKINDMISDIIEELIESPDRGHHNNYYGKLQELELYIDKTKNWNVESKMETPSMK